MGFLIRVATAEDVPVLTALIDASVRGLQASDYSPAQIDGALKTVFGVDTQLIADETYFVVETDDAVKPAIVACGGWSRRRTLCGGDQCAVFREDSLLDPAHEAAKIRAFFVHPDWARRGIGTLLLNTCETRAIEAGFRRLEMGSTLTGVPLYRARGYAEVEDLAIALESGEMLPVIRMEKRF